jgi:FkbM family methyltransferase
VPLRSKVRDLLQRRAPLLLKVYRGLRLRYVRAYARLRSSLVTIDGRTVDLGNDAGMKSSYLSGDYFRSFKAIVARHVRPGSVALDIGAHVGVTTILLADAVGSEGRVVAVEPYSAAFAVLTRNLERNRIANVRPLRVAMAATSGVLRLFVNRDHTGFNSLNQANAADFGRDPAAVTQVDVEALTLDDLVEREDLAPSFIKIDCQGAELDILKGAARLLRRAGAASIRIYLEFWPKGIENHSGVPAERFLEFLDASSIRILAAEDCGDLIQDGKLAAEDRAAFVSRIAKLPRSYTNLVLEK